MSNSKMSAEDLIDECWEMILSKLHYTHFETASLVCKRFLSLTNRLRLHLTVTDATILTHGTVSHLLRRFPNLKSLDLGKLTRFKYLENVISHSDLSPLPYLETLDMSVETLDMLVNLEVPVTDIGLRGLDLGNVNNKLKVLKCGVVTVSHRDLVHIVNCFPLLEELDISADYIEEKFTEDVVTDDSITFLSSRLNNLRKIDVSGRSFLTDKSVISLSSNCLTLTEVVLKDCNSITQTGVAFLLRNSTELSLMSVGSTAISAREPISFGRKLCAIKFEFNVISDELLSLIAKACIPLKRLILRCCSGYSIHGIRLLLSSHQSLELLELSKNELLTDESMISILKYLRSLVSVNLMSCNKLTCITLQALAKNCPILECVCMRGTNLGKEEGFLFESVTNKNIAFLGLSANSLLNDVCLGKIASICPKLEMLCVNRCPSITEIGIAEILERCSKLRHLEMNGCIKVQDLLPSSGLSNLEVLMACESRFDDNVLAKIANNCIGLKKLYLEACKHVTARGVENVVQGCKNLRVINLKECNLSSSIVEWMVFTTPSLKKIAPPSYAALTEEQRNLLLKHGCHVCKYLSDWHYFF